MSWEGVKEEMTVQKGLDASVADKIGEYVKHKGGPALLEKLRADETLMANASAKQGIEEMGMLFTYLEAFKVIDKVSFQIRSTGIAFDRSPNRFPSTCRSLAD